MKNRRSVVIGGAAVAALVVFDASALAGPVERTAKPPKEKPLAGWRVYHERLDGIVTVYEDVTELGGPEGGPVFIGFDDDWRRFLLPPGHFWMERGGSPLLPRRPC